MSGFSLFTNSISAGASDPRCGSSQSSPDILAGFGEKGRRKGRGRKRGWKGRDRGGRRGRGRDRREREREREGVRGWRGEFAPRS